MTGESQKSTPPQAAQIARTVDNACVEFEEAWRRGDSPSIEDFIKGVSDEVAQDLVVELVALEVELIGAGSSGPDVSGYVNRFPDHADDIRSALEDFPKHDVDTKFADELFMPGQKERAGADDESESADDQSGSVGGQLGDYRVIREIGRGGMGIVYEAEQLSLSRHVALKVLSGKLLSNDRGRMRFEREARTAAQLHHTNIVPVFGVGRDNGRDYYVMQFIQGLPLNDVLTELKLLDRQGSSTDELNRQELRIRRNDDSAADIAHSLVNGHFAAKAEEPWRHRGIFGDQTSVQTPGESREALTVPDQSTASRPPSTPVGHLSDSFSLTESSVSMPGSDARTSRTSTESHSYWHSVARVGVQVAEALHYAHGVGVLHRDIKPANLLLDMSGTVWVTDFGLAKLDDELDLTQTGDVMGTLRYMAPEAFRGRAEARSELYSLGLTLYELLALRPAFDQTERSGLAEKLINADIEPLDQRSPDIPTDLQTIVHKALEREPEHRYQTGQELADDLERFLNDEPIQARPLSAIERAMRWRRQNRGLAAALATVSVIILMVAVGSSIAAGYFQQLSGRLNNTVNELTVASHKLTRARDDADLSRTEAEQKAAENLRLAEQAESARRESLNMLADMQTERGMLASAEGDDATAALWFANAAGLAPHDEDRQWFNRLRAQNWLKRTVLPAASVRVPGSIRRIEFQPHGQLLMMSGPGSLTIWDPVSEQPLPWADDLSDVTGACWSPDGRQIAIGLSTGPVEIRDVPGGRRVVSLPSTKPVTTLAFSPNASRLAIAGDTIRIWTVSEKPERQHVWNYNSIVTSLVFNEAGNRLVACTADGRARMHNTEAETGSALIYEPLSHDIDAMPRHCAPSLCSGDC